MSYAAHETLLLRREGGARCDGARGRSRGMTEDRLRTLLAGEGEEALDHLAVALRAALDGDVEEHGDHATPPYGERFRVELVREGDAWCAADPD